MFASYCDHIEEMHDEFCLDDGCGVFFARGYVGVMSRLSASNAGVAHVHPRFSCSSALKRVVSREINII